jgi:hypothetical protein
MATKRTSIYLNPPLLAVIAEMGDESISGRLGQICDRYTEINRRARIKHRFSEAELNAFRDCCNGTIFGPAQLVDGAVLANFEDSLIDGLADKWEIDASATIAKLRHLTYPDQVALVEDIESFWRGVASAGADGELDQQACSATLPLLRA